MGEFLVSVGWHLLIVTGLFQEAERLDSLHAAWQMQQVLADVDAMHIRYEATPLASDEVSEWAAAHGLENCLPFLGGGRGGAATRRQTG